MFTYTCMYICTCKCGNDDYDIDKECGNDGYNVLDLHVYTCVCVCSICMHTLSIFLQHDVHMYI